MTESTKSYGAFIRCAAPGCRREPFAADPVLECFELPATALTQSLRVACTRRVALPRARTCEATHRSRNSRHAA